MLTACGGSTNEKARAAGVVPSDAIAYVSASLSPALAQQRDLAGIVRKFPASNDRKSFEQQKDAALTDALRAFGLDYGRDVKPWLGSEAALAVFRGAAPTPVAFLRTKDDGSARSHLDRVNPKPQYRLYKGFAVVARGNDAPATLDHVATQKAALANDTRFTKLVDRLHGQRLLLGWVDGAALRDMATARIGTQLPNIPGIGGFPGLGLSPLATPSTSAFDLHAENSALVAEGVSDGARDAAAGPPRLTDGLPTDTLAALTVFDLGGTIQKAVGPLLGIANQLGGARNPLSFPQLSGLDLQNDVLSWMHGETVVAAGPPAAGSTFPDLALVVAPSDQAAARSAYDKIKTAVTQKLGVPLVSRPAPGGTMDVFAQPYRPGVQPAMALLGDRFIVASRPEYLAAVAGRGGFGSADDVRRAAGSGGDTQAQLVIRIRQVRQTLARSHTPSRQDANLAPLDTLAFRVSRDAGLTRFSLKLTVR